MEASTIVLSMLGAVYALTGGISGLATWLNFRDEFASLTAKYGKPHLTGIAVILGLAWPVSCAVALLLYLGKKKVKADALAAEQAQSETPKTSE